MNENISSNSTLIIKNVSKSLVVKIVSMFVALFTTPAYISYFNSNTIVGFWFTILSMLTWILNCDMGIGNGLRDQLVYAIYEKDWNKVRNLISSSYIFLCGIGFVVLIVIFVVSMFMDWNKIFNISVDVISNHELNIAVSILLVAIVLQLVLRLITSILYALQESFIPGLLNLITNIIMLLFVILSNIFKIKSSIVFIALAYTIAVNVPLIIASFWVFKNKLSGSLPSYKFFRFNYARLVLRFGVVFLWLQLIALVIDNTNSYLITLFVGNEMVVDYQIYYKIFSIPFTLMLIFSTTLWSIVTKAKSENNWIWLKSNYRKMMFLALAACILEFLMIIPLQLVFDIWLGSASIKVNYAYAILFAILESVMIWRTLISTFANGLRELKIQFICLTLGAVINIPLAYIGVCIFNSYIAIVIANIISILPFCFVQTIWCNKFLKNNCNNLL